VSREQVVHDDGVKLAAAARGFALTVSTAMERDGKTEADDAVVIEALRSVAHLLQPGPDYRKLFREAVSEIREFHQWRKEYVWENACDHTLVEHYDNSCKRCGAILPLDASEEITYGRPYYVRPLESWEHELRLSENPL